MALRHPGENKATRAVGRQPLVGETVAGDKTERYKCRGSWRW